MENEKLFNIELDEVDGNRKFEMYSQLTDLQYKKLIESITTIATAIKDKKDESQPE